MSLGAQLDAHYLEGVSTHRLDPKGGAGRGERALMVICGTQFGPENDVLGEIVVLIPLVTGVTATASSSPSAT
jgi:hypothetical protein